MRDLNDKITGGTLSANEWNEVPSELQNLITSTGQTLSQGDLQQLVKGISNYASGGDFYADSGTANSYVLTPIGSKLGFNAYQDGQKVRFIPANSNTGASTVNVSALGVISIKNVDGSNISSGDIQAGEYIELVYESGTPSFVLTPQLNNARIVELKSGRKNYIVNGKQSIWQEGGSFSGGPNEYTADQHVVDTNGTTHLTTRESFAVGQTEVESDATYFHRSVITSSPGAANFAQLRFIVEGVRTLAGKTATFSINMKSDAARPVAAEIVQVFGTGGSPSANVESIGVTTFNLTTSFDKYTLTADIPSISGKTLGTNGNDHLAVVIWYDAGSNYDSRTNSLGQQSGVFDVSTVQLEEGSVVTRFEELNPEEEVAMCERYFCKSYPIDLAPGSSFINKTPHFLTDFAGSLAGSLSFSSRMRTSPTITIYNPSSGVINSIEDRNESNTRTVSLVESSEKGISLIVPTVAAAANVIYQFHFTALARL